MLLLETVFAAWVISPMLSIGIVLSMYIKFVSKAICDVIADFYITATHFVGNGAKVPGQSCNGGLK